ncbi:MAG: diguanylate cyclase [Clostridiaceae bacterium]|nr:diguanylate cyclase [Clostridiaceae bacterium]
MLINTIINSSLVFQHIIENMHDGVLTIDNSGVITTVNPAAEIILDKKKEEILDKKLSVVLFDYPENDGFIQIILDAVYDASVSHHSICAYYTGQHVKSLFVTTSFLKVKIEDAIQSIGITVLFSDVTELGELRDAATALDKIKMLNEKLERLSYLDELTSLPNRRFFNDTCNREWCRMIREQNHLAFIMADIDYFKEINDHYGHRVGDRCIAAVAKALNQALFRPADMVARFGGDEFIAIFPDTDMNGIQTIAKRMQKNIAELNIENAYSPFGKLTVSIGIAEQKPEQESSWKNLEDAADKALYKAKQNGKNQVAIFMAEG